MAGVYNLLSLVGSYSMQDGQTLAPLSTWEVDADVLKTNTPTSATRPNTSSHWRPFPYLSGASYDVSGIASSGDYYRVRYYGTVTKAVAFSSVEALDLFSDLVDEGDHYSFTSDWSAETYLPSYPEISLVNYLRFFGPTGSGATSLSGLEAEVTFEIEILDPPPPDPMTVYTQWDTYVLETGDACNYDLPLPENVTATSATLRIYSGSASYSSVYSSCSMHAVTWDEAPTDEYDIDLEDVNLYTSDNYIYLENFSNPNLFDNSNAELLITVEVDLGATRYTTTLTAINYGGG